MLSLQLWFCQFPFSISVSVVMTRAHWKNREEHWEALGCNGAKESGNLLKMPRKDWCKFKGVIFSTHTISKNMWLRCSKNWGGYCATGFWSYAPWSDLRQAVATTLQRISDTVVRSTLRQSFFKQIKWLLIDGYVDSLARRQSALKTWWRPIFM